MSCHCASRSRDGHGQVVEMSAENRPFIEIVLGGEPYRALLDSGAMVSLAGPRMIDRYASRLQRNTTTVRSVMEKVNRIVGELKVSLVVGGYLATLSLKALRGMEHDLILGMDFFEKFDVEMRPARGVWRARGGDWAPLAHLKTPNDPVVYAECAEIRRKEEKWTVENLVAKTIDEDPY